MLTCQSGATTTTITTNNNNTPTKVNLKATVVNNNNRPTLAGSTKTNKALDTLTSNLTADKVSNSMVKSKVALADKGRDRGMEDKEDKVVDLE